VPVELRARVEELHERLCDRYGDFAAGVLLLKAEDTMMSVSVDVERERVAREFVQAVNELLG